jgi:ComF family protein
LEQRAAARAMRGSVGWARTAWGDVVATVFPADCRVCGGPLVGADDSSILIPVCEGCARGIRAQTDGARPMVLCGCCGEALDMESVRFAGARLPAEGLLCRECRLVRPAFERAVAYGLYEDELREMIHLLKYERMRSVARPLGGKLTAAMRMLEGAAAKELVVVAVPLFPAKERARGYNQAVLLAESALGELKKARPGWRLRRDALRRVRDTESQFALTPKQRRANLRGAFAVSESADLMGREVLLVDDIYTSGATARECARVLRRAGAAKVWVATAARAQREMVAFWNG